MKRTQKWTALALALALMLAFSSPSVLAQGETATPGMETLPKETLPEETPAAETAAEATPENTVTATPAPAATLAPVTKEEMPKPSPDARAEAVVTEPEGMALFELPAQESTILGRLEAGSVLTLQRLGQTWCRVKSGETEGWVPTYALGFGYGSPQPALALIAAPGGKLTLRAEMTTKSKAMGSVPSGRAVLLLAKSEPFSLIRHENLEGYVLTAHLEEEPVVRELGTLTNVISVDPTREANVRLRAQPSRKGAVYTTVKSGQQVVVMDVKDGWARIEYEGYHGYMMEDYLKQPE